MVGSVISVFIMILIISILAGLTFLFIAELKTQTASQSPISDTVTVSEEEVSPTDLGTSFATSTLRDITCTVSSVTNDSGAVLLVDTNYTVTGCSIANLTSDFTDASWEINYTYVYRPYTTAENAVNDTEEAGTTLVDYLPLIFLAVIFGAILTLVLKIILPYLNLGQSLGGF